MKFFCNILLLAGLPFLVASAEYPTPTTTASPNNNNNHNHHPAAPIHTITVGGGTNLRFNPPYLNYVAPGTVLRFDFLGKNHTLTESSFDDPCKKLDAPHAIDTGFQNFNPNDVSGLKTFDFKVTSSEPRFFYCKQANGTPSGHCLKGMVFAINMCGQAFQEFQWKAMKSQPKVRGIKREALPNYE